MSAQWEPSKKTLKRIERMLKATRLVRKSADEVVWDVDEIGFVIARYIAPGSPNNPSDRPWHLCCVGTTHLTAEHALIAFVRGWFKPSEPVDRSYERAEACFGEQP